MARLGVPLRVLVAGTEWSIEYKTADEVRGLKECSGFADAAATQIVVRSDLSPERQRETVVHEIAHAAFEESACAAEVAVRPCRCCGKRRTAKEALALEEALVRQWIPCLLAALENAGIVTVHRPKPARRKHGKR